MKSTSTHALPAFRPNLVPHPHLRYVVSNGAVHLRNAKGKHRHRSWLHERGWVHE